MRFSDSAAQKLIRDTARAYLADNYPWQRLYAFERDEGQLTGTELKAFARQGWLGLLAPESAGGPDVSLLEAAVVIDEFGYSAVPAPIRVSNVAAYCLSKAPATHAVDDHLTNLTRGHGIYTVSETTRRRGHHTHLGATAPALSSSGGRLSGTLPLVPFADLAEFVVAPLEIDGERAFAAVPLQGVRLEKARLLDRPSYFNVHFEHSASDKLLTLAIGQEAEELHERCDALVTGFSAIELAGIMQRTLEMTAQYISNRVQFGQPIATFQAVRHRAAELLTQVETTRWVAYHALWRFQENPGDSSEIWLAKHWAVRAADRACTIAHLLHGGIGATMDYPLHLFTQGLMGFAVRGGTMNEMVARIVESMDLLVVPATASA